LHILDNIRGMEKQVNSICKSCYYEIRNIGLIRKYINDETCKTLVQALIIPRLDYGNALLYNIPLSLINRLQQVQNCATRLVTLTKKMEHNTSFVPAVLASCTFQIAVQDPVSDIQCIVWNSITVSKRSDRKNIPVTIL